MDEDRRSAVAADRGERPARSKRPSIWVVSDEDDSDETDCDHPGETLRLVGDDGRNAYYQCERCEAVIVTQDELIRAAPGENGAGADATAGATENRACATGNGVDATAGVTDRNRAADPEAPG